MQHPCRYLIKGDVMACAGGCGGHNKLDRTLNTKLYEDLTLDSRSMLTLNGDDQLCEPYHGQFTGTYVYVVGYGTEHERMFLRSLSKQAEQYAATNGVKVGRLISVRSLCHDRVVAAIGA
jgi:hypothetical protein